MLKTRQMPVMAETNIYPMTPSVSNQFLFEQTYTPKQSPLINNKNKYRRASFRLFFFFTFGHYSSFNTHTMKRTLKISILGGIIATIGGYGVYTSQKGDAFFDIVKANIEALAQTEIGPGPEGKKYGCAYGIMYGGVGFVRDCVTCDWTYFVTDYSGVSNCYEH